MRGRRAFRVLGACLVALVCLAHLRGGAAQTAAPIVHVVPIHGLIDLGLAPFLERAIDEAMEAGAAAIVLDINTFGGRVDAAIAMRDTLVNAPIRTIAYVNPRAISAGALIALACETVVMANGGTIGAAAPVVADASGGSQPADEKSVSYLRKEFRATADARGRPPEFAEAMVDLDVEIAGVVEKGKLLTLTTSEAMEHKVVDLTAPTMAAALEAAGLPEAVITTAQQTWAETVVRFLTIPAVSSILMTVGLLGLLVELRTPGFAVPGAVGIAALALFFWGQWIVRLAGFEEVLLVTVGLLLIALEIFVIPGITIAGIAGVLAVVTGLGLTLVGAGATTGVVLGALGQVAISLLLAIGLGLVLMRMLPRMPFGRRLVLDTEVDASHGYQSAPESDQQWMGRRGTALSPLRPAGIAAFDGTRVDVVSEGGFIDAGTAIEVTRVDGNRIVVRQPAARQEPTHE